MQIMLFLSTHITHYRECPHIEFCFTQSCFINAIQGICVCVLLCVYMIKVTVGIFSPSPINSAKKRQWRLHNCGNTNRGNYTFIKKKRIKTGKGLCLRPIRFVHLAKIKYNKILSLGLLSNIQSANAQRSVAHQFHPPPPPFFFWFLFRLFSRDGWHRGSVGGACIKRQFFFFVDF